MRSPGLNLMLSLNFVFRLCLLVAFLGVVAVAVRWTDAAQVRYNRYLCQYGIIYEQDGPIDIAIIGSSRSVQGVDADLMSQLAPGNQRVVSLAKSWRGQGINFTMMRDLLENRAVRVMLVEANLPETGVFHGHFFLVGRMSDWIMSNEFRRDHHFDVDAFAVTLRNVVDRVTEQWTYFIIEGGVANRETEPAVTNCRVREEVRRDDAYWLQKLETYEEYYEGRYFSWELDSEEARHDTGFIDALVELAELNNVQLLFYHVPEAYNLSLDPNFATTFYERFGAPLLIPPPKLTRELEALELFADATHLLQPGREMYTNWLLSAVESRLERD